MRKSEKRSWLFVLFVTIVMTLAACTGAMHGLTKEEQASLTPMAKYYQLKDHYLKILEQANSYAQRPFCTDVLVIGCSDPEIVIKIAEAAEDADRYYELAEIAARAGNETELEGYASLTRSALAVISQMIIEATLEDAGGEP